MKLKTIKVSGYKNIYNIALEMTSLLSIVAVNNFGKSNVLEAIGFGFLFLNASDKTRYSLMRNIDNIPLNPQLENDNFSFELEFEAEGDSQYKYVNYGFEFSWSKDDESGNKIEKEWLAMRESPSVRYTRVLRRNTDTTEYKPDKTSASFKKLKLNVNQLAINVLSMLEGVKYDAVIKDILGFEYYVCSTLDLNTRFDSVPLDFILPGLNKKTDGFDDDDVSREVYMLKKSYPEHYDKFKEAILTLFPEFENIEVNTMAVAGEEREKLEMFTKSVTGSHDMKVPFRIKDEVYRVMIKSAYINQYVDLSMMSKGTKRIFCLLANAFVAKIRSIGIIGIEELETSIHPRMMKELLEILNETLDYTSVLITSHSPYLIQYLKPENIYVGVPSAEGVASFRKLKNKKIKKMLKEADNLGMSSGEYLFNLMAGESTEHTILKEILEDD